MNPVLLIAAFLLLANAAFADSTNGVVFAKAELKDDWKPFPTRTLADLPATVINTADSDLSRFGGWKKFQLNATGFFYPTNWNGRWWLVDPDGYLYLQKGVSDVNVSRKTVLQEKFGSESNWATNTTGFLRSLGFNGLGAWSNTKLLRETAHPLVYTRILNFMSAYGAQRGGTYQQPGHTGYPKDCIFVFDPAFETFCDTHARELADAKNDPWLLGYFSDNEMPLRREALKNYLLLPPTDSGYQAALNWLHQRHGNNATSANITERDKEDFLAFVVTRYFRIVSAAIKKYDPNHLYLGSRFNGRVLEQPEVFRAAGPYLDVVSVNYYRDWNASPEKLEAWSQSAHKPILVTEWYAKAMDAGLANTGGAGWIVKTQRDRGLFYQNFTLGLLESKACVGWDWFKYADNDPSNTKTDPSNRDANKGIVNILYQPYQPLIEAMKPLNDRAYSLVDYFDKKDKATVQSAHNNSADSQTGFYAN